MEYNEWRLELIRLILDDTQVNSTIKENEIRCVVNNDFRECFDDGDSPSEAWDSEKREMTASQ